MLFRFPKGYCTPKLIAPRFFGVFPISPIGSWIPSQTRSAQSSRPTAILPPPYTPASHGKFAGKSLMVFCPWLTWHRNAVLANSPNPVWLAMPGSAQDCFLAGSLPQRLWKKPQRRLINCVHPTVFFAGSLARQALRATRQGRSIKLIEHRSY
jgi:hypothetical protein